MKKFTAILLILLFVFTLSSCEKMPAEDVAGLMLDSIKARDYDSLKLYADEFIFTTPSLPENIMDAAYNNFTYEILSATDDADGSKLIEVSLTNIDISAVMKGADDEISRLTFDEKKINSTYHSSEVAHIYTLSLMENAENKVTTNITLRFTKISGNWVCSLGEEKTKELMTAFFGGYGL